MKYLYINDDEYGGEDYDGKGGGEKGSREDYGEQGVVGGCKGGVLVMYRQTKRHL